MAVSGIGSILDGKYEIVRPLGSGGMGEVFLARHLHLDETRVIKVLRRDLAADEASQRRFLREARLATQIKHPNVAILHDCTRLPDGAFYMVWEHVEGRDAGDWLAQQGPFPLPVALNLGIQALRGLEAIHSTGVIHRDVSPDNLMIYTGRRGDLRLKIIDLGLARALTADSEFEVTQVGTFMGKLRYCSPEQARMSEGETLDRRTDLYSLALVLYEMISGTLPFTAPGPAAVYQRVSEEPLPLVGRNPEVEVPDAVAEVVMRALARDPDDRYHDAVAFIDALDAAGSALSDVSTRKVPVVDGASRAGRDVPPPGTTPSRAGELTADERQALLAQIDRAASRVKEDRGEEAAALMGQAQEALREGRLEEARRLVERLEPASAGSAALSDLRAALEEAESDAEYRRRVAEVEGMLTRYLQRKQKPLAQVALDSLLELAPNHPRRSDFETWVALLDEEVEQDARVGQALAAGREALAAEDFRKARRQLEALRKLDEDAAGRFAAEVADAERESETEAEVERRRQRFEALLEAGDLGGAERQLASLEGKVSRLTVDGYRERLEGARSAVARRQAEEETARAFRARVGAKDWKGAREAARRLVERFPGSERGRELLAEAVRYEEAANRRAAIADGEKQIEDLIGRGEAEQARLALRVLLQLDPENPRRARLQKRIDALAD